MSNQFYMVIPSVGSDPSNANNKWRTHLPQKVILSGDGWHIGLAGIGRLKNLAENPAFSLPTQLAHFGDTSTTIYKGGFENSKGSTIFSI